MGSRLNPNAFNFVPGQTFRVPPTQPAQPTQPPIERPVPTEAPPPAPTISLNIGGSKPAPAPAPTPAPAKPAPAPAAAPAPAPVKELAHAVPTSKPSSGTSSPAPRIAEKSTTFTLERAKTDTSAIAQEVQNAVDEATLSDLYGNGVSPRPCKFSTC